MKSCSALIPAAFLLLVSCATIPPPSESGSSTPAEGDLSKTQALLVEGARSVLGKDRLVIRGKEFRIDCTGVVMAIYYYAGIDLSPAMSAYSGNGVNRLYSYLREKKLIYRADIPAPGDIIFWDNTWDANEDGVYNDYLTHTGMVVEVDKTGLITYVHHNYSKGIVTEYMNLTDPDTERATRKGEIVIINSPMRMRGSPPAPEGQRLASHLAKSFGKGYLLPR
ncbi:MAG: CHAP domain-containing protein [Spirochaetales bacterium]|nr:CHAP domain-containing protein [Spirochaetales bacterium]